MENEQTRRRQVTWALALTEGTNLAPSAYELELLDNYVRGVLTIEEVIRLVEASERTAQDD